MATIKETTRETITISPDGNEERVTTQETVDIHRDTEPSYIKLYERAWCGENNAIPRAYRQLFLSLAQRMSYSDKRDLNYSQTVKTSNPWKKDIMKECGWTSEDSLIKGLRALCDCNAIHKIARGVYQINPSYASKGEWRYTTKYDRGGVKDLIEAYNNYDRYEGKSVETRILASEYDEDDETEFIMSETSIRGCSEDEQLHDQTSNPCNQPKPENLGNRNPFALPPL